jgi:hypothetical protein
MLIAGHAYYHILCLIYLSLYADIFSFIVAKLDVAQGDLLWPDSLQSAIIRGRSLSLFNTSIFFLIFSGYAPHAEIRRTPYQFAIISRLRWAALLLHLSHTHNMPLWNGLLVHSR